MNVNEELGFLLHIRGRDKQVYNSEDSMTHLLVLACLVITVNGIIKAQ